MKTLLPGCGTAGQGSAILPGRIPVLFLEDPIEIGKIVKSALLCDLEH